MDIKATQITGKGKTLCEDVICIEQLSQDFCFAGIADGQSQKKYCREGGCAALSVVYEYIRHRGVEEIKTDFMDEVQYELAHKIRKKLFTLAEYRGSDPEEFASTICSFACNPRSGDFVLIHLGDGCIIGVNSEGQIRQISTPENGLTRYQTYLTTSRNALFHIRLSWGNLKNYTGIFIMTDGADSICRSTTIDQHVRAMLLRKDFNALSARLKKSLTSDDASLIMIDL